MPRAQTPRGRILLEEGGEASPKAVMPRARTPSGRILLEEGGAITLDDLLPARGRTLVPQTLWASASPSRAATPVSIAETYLASASRAAMPVSLAEMRCAPSQRQRVASRRLVDPCLLVKAHRLPMPPVEYARSSRSWNGGLEPAATSICAAKARRPKAHVHARQNRCHPMSMFGATDANTPEALKQGSTCSVAPIGSLEDHCSITAMPSCSTASKHARSSCAPSASPECCPAGALGLMLAGVLPQEARSAPATAEFATASIFTSWREPSGHCSRSMLSEQHASHEPDSQMDDQIVLEIWHTLFEETNNGLMGGTLFQDGIATGTSVVQAQSSRAGRQERRRGRLGVAQTACRVSSS